MIGLDTNVIVRYVTQDDPVQSPKATKLIESLSADEPGFIPLVVVVELIWVMQACYHASRDSVVHMLDTLLRTETLIVEQADIVWQALRHFRKLAQSDFADCLIERSAHAAGCKQTITFDRNAIKSSGMKPIG